MMASWIERRAVNPGFMLGLLTVLWVGWTTATLGEAQDGNVDRKALARVEAPPLGLPPVSVPEENAPTIEKIALGRKLFFDRRLSFNNTMSCAMCHVPEQGFTNNELATPVGVEGKSIRRNAPTILNVAYAVHVFHDGRETSLENQTVGPLLAKNEMANPSVGWLMAKISGLPDYDGLFERAFGGGPSLERLGQAIASWERTVLAGNSPFDRWRYGNDTTAMTKEQLEGLTLFMGKAGCVSCHRVGDKHALFTDQAFHDTGIGYQGQDASARQAPVMVELAPDVVVPLDRKYVNSVGDPRPPDLGRFEVTLNPKDKWQFKTPSLRNVAITGPYMHDGSLRTLENVVRFYNQGGIPHDGVDPLIRSLSLSEKEIAALVAFLESLTSADIPTLQKDARSVAVGN
jgi:cytochrome c peroxidase